MHAGTVAQIHTDVVQARYARIQRLAEVARDNAPDPRYVDNFVKNSQVGNPPFLTERQREKVVKYINEVRHRKLPTHNVRGKIPNWCDPPWWRCVLAHLHSLMLRLQLAEDFELSMQTGGLACNYFDRYLASVPPPPHTKHRDLPLGSHLVIINGGDSNTDCTRRRTALALQAGAPSLRSMLALQACAPRTHTRPSRRPAFHASTPHALRARLPRLSTRALPEQIAGALPAQTEGKRNIQMIASTCLLIAAKFSDRKLPPLSELQKVHHNQCGADDFAALELRILDGLHWKLLVPLPHAFIDQLRELCVDAPFSPTIEERVQFFIDLSTYGPPATAALTPAHSSAFSHLIPSDTHWSRILCSDSRALLPCSRLLTCAAALPHASSLLCLPLRSLSR